MKDSFNLDGLPIKLDILSSSSLGKFEEFKLNYCAKKIQRIFRAYLVWRKLRASAQ